MKTFPNNTKIKILRNQVKDARESASKLREQLRIELGRVKGLQTELADERRLAKIVREDQARIRAEKRAARKYERAQREMARQMKDAERMAKAQARLEKLQATIAKRADRASRKASKPVIYSPEQIAALNADRALV